jgi:hypothetical protein
MLGVYWGMQGYVAPDGWRTEGGSGGRRGRRPQKGGAFTVARQRAGRVEYGLWARGRWGEICGFGCVGLI